MARESSASTIKHAVSVPCGSLITPPGTSVFSPCFLGWILGDRAVGLFSIEGVGICTGSDIPRAAWRMLPGPGARSSSAPEPQPPQLRAAGGRLPQKQPGLEKGSAWGARQSEMGRMETVCLRKSLPLPTPSRREAEAAFIFPPRV